MSSRRSKQSGWCLARYKESQFYYPGRIIQRNSDGMCSIRFDDGDQEEVPGSHVLIPGSRVEAAYDGGSDFYPGVLERVNADGSCAVQYDDGDKESHVHPAHVRAERTSTPKPSSRKRSAPKATTSPKPSNPKRSSKQSSWCLAPYNDAFYYPGRIIQRNSDGTCSIRFDDGDQEEVPGSHVLIPGSRVEAAYDGGSDFYPGVLERVNADGSCAVQYDDGDKESHVHPAHVRAESATRILNQHGNIPASSGAGVVKQRVSRSCAPAAAPVARTDSVLSTQAPLNPRPTPRPTPIIATPELLSRLLRAPSLSSRLGSRYHAPELLTTLSGEI